MRRGRPSTVKPSTKVLSRWSSTRTTTFSTARTFAEESGRSPSSELSAPRPSAKRLLAYLRTRHDVRSSVLGRRGLVSSSYCRVREAQDAFEEGTRWLPFLGRAPQTPRP